jgi:hypothetical protein
MLRHSVQDQAEAVNRASFARAAPEGVRPSVTKDPFTGWSAKGTWFTEDLQIRQPEGSELLSHVLRLVAEVEERQRKRTSEATDNHAALVAAILANAFRCHFYRNPPLVAYLRKADGYNGKPVWLSGKALARTIDLLAKLGLLDGNLGEHGSGASTYQATEQLLKIGTECGVTVNSFSLPAPAERLVRVRSAAPERRQMEFPPSAETIRWTELLRSYNEFIAQQRIAIDLSPEEEKQWAAKANAAREESGPELKRPELFQLFLYRQFNNGSFEQGGRLYGGWWINTPKELRKKITINGEPTVELDFAGCAIRMLYHEKGIDFREDPYHLDEIAAYEAKRRLRPGHYREAIKALTQALINDQTGTCPEKIALDGVSFRPSFTRGEVRAMIERKHAPIADSFGTGAGLRLQRRDSDLALAIGISMMTMGLVVLPIHDSFLAPAKDKDQLMETMVSQYENEFKYKPIVN